MEAVFESGKTLLQVVAEYAARDLRDRAEWQNVQHSAYPADKRDPRVPSKQLLGFVLRIIIFNSVHYVPSHNCLHFLSFIFLFRFTEKLLLCLPQSLMRLPKFRRIWSF